jgi:hypothetical protein
MKKNTLIRSEKLHAVKVEEGSSVAQRKSPKKSSPDPSDAVPDNMHQIPSAKSKQSESVRIEPILIKPAGKTKAPSKRTEVSAGKPVKKSLGKIHPKSMASHPPPEQPVWEQDNPVKDRIEALKLRNAELAEQLQRLQQTQPVRGKQS